MKITIHSMVLLLAMLAFSCGERPVYSEINSNFPDNCWKRESRVEFQPEITDTTVAYDIILKFRHTHGFMFKTLNLSFNIVSPNGDTEQKVLQVPIFDESDQYISECMGDYCDLETVIESNFSFSEVGTYKIQIEHMHSVDPLPLVMEVGLVVRKISDNN